MKKEMEEILDNYMPLIRKEVAKFKNSGISGDELMSEAYYIVVNAVKRGRHRSKAFPAYIKKSISLGLLRYILKERKREYSGGKR